MARFINISHKSDPQPSLIAVDAILRVRPGAAYSAATGREDQCTIFLKIAVHANYEEGMMLEPEYVEVHLPVREIVRRMREEVFEC